MLCLIYNIHNPLNYDVGFPSLSLDEHPVIDAHVHKIADYSVYDKETDTVGEPIPINLYKIRLNGVIRRKQDVTRQDVLQEGYIKHKLIQWNNRTGGVFFIKIKELDKYGRIKAQLYDPVTGESFTDWLITNFKQVYRPYE